MKIRFDIEYDGTKFCGWQKQDGVPTVQDTLEKAISNVFNISNVTVYGAGRTDTGVHAINQVAHIETFDYRIIDTWMNNMFKLSRAVNFYLHGSGAILKNSSIVSNNFHARFSAIRREYVYIIYNSPIDSVLLTNRIWYIHKHLDEHKMNEAAQQFIGTHNFNAFRASDCQANSPIKTVDNISVTRMNDFIIIDIAAKSFLHNQVRIITGTLKQIGIGKLDCENIKILLESGDRTKSGPTAPPFGLYLKNIEDPIL